MLFRRIYAKKAARIMILLSVCALLVMTAETHTQPEKTLVQDEDRKDVIDTIYLMNAGADTERRTGISDTVWHEIMPRKRRQRSTVIVGKTVMAGLRAVKYLLFGAKKVPSISEYQLHAKHGGLKRAVEEFEYINLQNVEILRSKTEYGRSGQIGNREIILKINKYTRTASIDIRKLQRDAKLGKMLPGQITDRIIYE